MPPVREAALLKTFSKPGRAPARERARVRQHVRKHYVAVVHKDADCDFGVSFPDFPGAVTAAPTLEEAIKRAGQALALHVEGTGVCAAAIAGGQSRNDVLTRPPSNAPTGPALYPSRFAQLIPTRRASGRSHDHTGTKFPEKDWDPH